MVQFLDWEGLRGRGLTGDLDSIFTTWMDWNGLEWAVMAFNGYFIPTHSNPFQSCWNFHQNHPLCHWNSFQFIPTHSDSFQPIPIHSNPFKSCWCFYQNHPLLFQFIPTHSNPFQFIPTHSNSFQPIPIHSNSFQPIQILLMFLSKSPFMLFQFIPTHSNPFQSIPIHSNSFQLSLNPPINPYLLAPPILGTQLKRTNNSSIWRFHSSPFRLSFGLYPKV